MYRTFIETDIFTKKWSDCGLDNETLREFQNLLLKNPGKGEVIRGTGGLRKIRFGDKKKGKGKSGGYRIIYLDLDAYCLLFLILVYGKDEKENLTQSEKNQMKKLTTRLKQFVRKGG